MSTTEIPEVQPSALRYRAVTGALLLVWLVGLTSQTVVFAVGLAIPAWSVIFALTSVSALTMSLTNIARARRSDVAAIAGNSQDERQRLLGLKSQAVASAAVMLYGCLLVIGGVVGAVVGVALPEPTDVMTALIVVAMGLGWTHGMFLLMAARHYSRKG